MNVKQIKLFTESISDLTYVYAQSMLSLMDVYNWQN